MKKANLKMGKSLNHIGKKAGKHEQMLVERKLKLQKKEDYKKFYDSYPVVEISPDWICSACDEFYCFVCEDREVHQREWREKAREFVRDDIERDFRKVGMVGRIKNRVGYKVARKCFEDEYYGDFILSVR